MGKLIYSMITSLDGFVSDRNGEFAWGTPDNDLHAFIKEHFASIGTYLYGRRMYETMVYWETADQLPDEPAVVGEYARVWQAADKVVYSTTLERVASGRTRIERSFEPEDVRALKDASERDISIDGPHLAAQAIQAGLVDEYQLIVAPTIVGGGNRFFPEGFQADLTLLDERRFDHGFLFLRYAAKGSQSS